VRHDAKATTSQLCVVRYEVVYLETRNDLYRKMILQENDFTKTKAHVERANPPNSP